MLIQKTWVSLLGFGMSLIHHDNLKYIYIKYFCKEWYTLNVYVFRENRSSKKLINQKKFIQKTITVVIRVVVLSLPYIVSILWHRSQISAQVQIIIWVSKLCKLPAVFVWDNGWRISLDDLFTKNTQFNMRIYNLISVPQITRFYYKKEYFRVKYTCVVTARSRRKVIVKLEIIKQCQRSFFIYFNSLP